jgi:phospholipase D1/2
MPQMTSMSKESILNEGRNCWRIRKAKRLSFLIDADAYFRALISAVDQAEKAVYISGWDIDSRVRLIRSSEKKESPEVSLGPYLNEKAMETPGLNIYILCWDFSVIYTLEREWLQSLKLDWQTHRRVHFHLDSEHPAGASHHQKFVVVDDAIAFCGGIDLTKNRWDTPEHNPRDSRRVNPDGKKYGTFHDIQTAAEGDVAVDLGDLFRLRWLWATGRQLAPVDSNKHLDWPQESSPDMTHVRTAVARTHPPYKGREAVREVEGLYQDIIASARHYLYLENQYFTSPVIADALIKSLEKKKVRTFYSCCPEDRGVSWNRVPWTPFAPSRLNGF